MATMPQKKKPLHASQPTISLEITLQSRASHRNRPETTATTVVHSSMSAMLN